METTGTFKKDMASFAIYHDMDTLEVIKAITDSLREYDWKEELDDTLSIKRLQFEFTPPLTIRLSTWEQNWPFARFELGELFGKRVAAGGPAFYRPKTITTFSVSYDDTASLIIEKISHSLRRVGLTIKLVSRSTGELRDFQKFEIVELNQSTEIENE